MHLQCSEHWYALVVLFQSFMTGKYGKKIGLHQFSIANPREYLLLWILTWYEYPERIKACSRWLSDSDTTGTSSRAT